MSRQSSLQIVDARLPRPEGKPFPIWACAGIILGISALCYWLLFLLIGGLLS
jgi:hypothetical protein